jgi:hypothetical protein
VAPVQSIKLPVLVHPLKSYLQQRAPVLPVQVPGLFDLDRTYSLQRGDAHRPGKPGTVDGMAGAVFTGAHGWLGSRL